MNWRTSRRPTSKADGDFMIDEIEPGDYVVALNVLEPPTSKTNRSSRYERISPYPPTYYPGVAERVKATVFHIDRNTTLQLPEWILPAQLKERGLSGTRWTSGSTSRPSPFLPPAGSETADSMCSKDRA